ncbi:hypothetical protein M6D93_12530 [Jatrophihabitans telluris]|uniref:Uncharacterized protein n=1 Tax=Jatrophihabitans telluris TaxID=2038343 RepID=A0ABY4QTW7_9ACTN|nr:hypothetical protein [Jatrophihabitans telluris]UQX87124.1 hypothetical protein M6D93_12530 [Jatrophihabitans telluris]
MSLPLDVLRRAASDDQRPASAEPVPTRWDRRASGIVVALFGQAVLVLCWLVEPLMRHAYYDDVTPSLPDYRRWLARFGNDDDGLRRLHVTVDGLSRWWVQWGLTLGLLGFTVLLALLAALPSRRHGLGALLAVSAISALALQIRALLACYRSWILLGGNGANSLIGAAHPAVWFGCAGALGVALGGLLSMESAARQRVAATGTGSAEGVLSRTALDVTG